MPATTPLTPMTPHAAISAFSYLRAVQADDVDAAREFAGAASRMPELLVDVATQVVVPVTALPGVDAGEPCEDTFALEALGRVLVTSLRIWAQAGPDAAEGIARAVIDFADADEAGLVSRVLTDPDRTMARSAVLRQLEAAHALIWPARPRRHRGAPASRRPSLTWPLGDTGAFGGRDNAASAVAHRVTQP